VFATAHTVRLAGETDFAGFRRQARGLLALGVAPDEVAFETEAAGAADDEPTALHDAAPAASPLRLTADLLQLLEQATRHAEPQRFVLIYRVLWRIAQCADVQHDPLDADRQRLASMAQAVRRDMHKMKAFVRFRPITEPGIDDPLHVAWFEPDHHIVDAVAPFFVRRFAGMRFVILTPRRSLRWNGQALQFGPGAQRADAPGADAGEALWLTYYAHIFNPARLKLQAMAQEMPRKYWKNLPEAVLIAPLAAAAASRAGAMVEAAPTSPRRRIPISARAADAAGPGGAVGAVRALGIDTPADERLALLQARRRAADHCRDCPIGQHATQTVHGEGPIDARLMMVGEQPGDTEDLCGRPLVGPSGQLFDRALAALGWPREQLYISNAVRHFKYLPRGKRRLHKTPAQQEADACLHWLEEEISLVRPAAIIALGATAARALLRRDVAVQRERGQWFEHPASGTPVLVTLHPAALLRMAPEQQAGAFDGWVEELGRAAGVAGA
jgi:DNA polymerase